MKISSQNRLLRLLPSILGLTMLLVTWWRGDGGLFLLFAFFILIAGGETAYRFLAAPCPTPYLGMLLAPLLLLNYSSVGDFRVRLACFVMLLYVLVLSWRQPDPRVRIPLAGASPWRVWLLSFLVFSLTAAALYAQGIHLSGDEPHYVMIAQSLVEDGDFDLKNNLENKTYLQYLPVEIRFHGSIRAGRYHSFHLPGMSFLLLPFYFLFKLLGGLLPGNLFFRLAAAWINAFFALGLFLVLQTAPAKKDSSRLFIFFLLTFPLLFHAIHLFPELPAASLVLFAYVFARNQQRYFLSGLLLACVPWFHLKYAIPTLILAMFIAAWIWDRKVKIGARMKQLGLFFAAPAASLALLGLYSKALYGSFNPNCISPEKNFFSIPLGWKIETLLSFFLDQRDGLLVYAPIFLLVFLVGKKEIRSGIRDFSLLAAIFISYVLCHAFTTVRGAYSPAARPTLFVMWIMAVFLAAYYRHSPPGIFRALFRLLAGLTVFATVWFFYYPLFLYQPVTREVSQRASSLLLFMGSAAVNIASGFPSFLKKPNAAYLPNWIWLGLLAIGIGLYYTRISWRAIAKPARLVLPALGLLLLFFICYIPHVQLKTRYTAAGLSFYSNSKNFTFRKELGAFKILAGQDYDLFFDLKGSAAAGLNLRLLNSENVTLKVKNGRQTLLAENQAPESRLNLRLKALKKFNLGKKTLVHLGLETSSLKNNAFFLLKFE